MSVITAVRLRVISIQPRVVYRSLLASLLSRAYVQWSKAVALLSSGSAGPCHEIKIRKTSALSSMRVLQDFQAVLIYIRCHWPRSYGQVFLLISQRPWSQGMEKSALRFLESGNMKKESVKEIKCKLSRLCSFVIISR